ncbi:MAG: lysophospholipid acyltransferase family protein [Myxococcaceae bacterium]
MKKLIHLLVLATWLAVLFPFTMILLPFNLKSGSMWIARLLWAPVLVWVSRAKVVVHGRENVDPNRPTIYVSNHQSSFDIPVHLVSIPVNYRFVAKSSLKWVPMLGWYLWAAGHILIDRGHRHRAITSLQKAGRKIRQGTSIMVYPEGTRSDDGRILPFKKGPFALALEAGVAVCPVTIEGSARLMPKNSWDVNTGGEIHVKIGRPIDPAPYGPAGRDALMRDVRNVIIAQSLELGGKGGDPDDVIAASGREGVSARKVANG